MKNDEKKVDSLFKLMQIKEENIQKFKDATYDEIYKAFNIIEAIARKASVDSR